MLAVTFHYARHLRLVETNAVSQDLKGIAGAVAGTVARGWSAVLGADVVRSTNSGIASQDGVGEVTALLRDVENEVWNLQGRLRNGQVEDSIAS